MLANFLALRFSWVFFILKISYIHLTFLRNILVFLLYLLFFQLFLSVSKRLGFSISIKSEDFFFTLSISSNCLFKYFEHETGGFYFCKCINLYAVSRSNMIVCNFSV